MALLRWPGRDRLGIFDAMQQVSPNVPVVMGAGLVAVPCGFQFRYRAAQQVEAVQYLQLRPGSVGGQYRHEFVADPFGRHPVQQVRVPADAPSGARFPSGNRADSRVSPPAASAQDHPGTLHRS